MRPNMRLFALAIGGLLGCTSPEQRQAARAVVERSAVSAESAAAARARSLPATGKWDEARLVERLVSAGLAPQAIVAAPGEAYWGVPAIRIRLGNATLEAHVYSDSLARSRVTDGLDSLTIAPKGIEGRYSAPHLLITNNNLAVVLIGGSERHQERVSNALTAGLPSFDIR